MAVGDRYELVRQLAVGGMGEVFLAMQRGPMGFARPVVVKRILSHLAHDETFVQQFLNEGRLAARISHPAVVQILELDQSQDGAWYLVLEYVHGLTLRAVLKALRERGEQLPLELGAWVCAQALHGLAAAHELRDEHGQLLCLVHRDVSPDNLMLSYGGAVKLLDFGIARAMASVSSTRPGQVKGKLPYLAPEVIGEDRVTPAADLWAMGVVLHEIAAGQRPFKASNDAALMRLILDVEAPSLVGVDPLYSALVSRALAKAPESRFGSAREMAEALEQFAARAVIGPSALTVFLRERFGEVPPPRAEDAVDVPLGTLTFERPGATTVEPATLPTETPARGFGPRARWVVAPLLLGAVAAIGLLVRRGASNEVSPGAMERAIRDSGAPAGDETVAAAPEPRPLPVVDAGAPVEVAPADRPPADAGVRSVMARGTLRLFVQPWAEVVVDRQQLGVTPLAPIALPPGKHRVRLSNPQLGVTRTETVVIEAGKTRTLRVTLAPP
ncbi:MAG: serine/threonine-protein kinase [Myxococcaceae bacterium]|nr:serine/threonine-protein kinase [Myxococcaceae bacterium]